MRSIIRQGYVFGIALIILLVGMQSVGMQSALAQSKQPFPSKPVRLVVPFPPGGPLDIIGRLLSRRLSASLGVPVIVENRPGAGGNVGVSEVAKAVPDGHTLLLTLFSTITNNPHLYEAMPFDPIKDFAPVTALYTSDSVLVVHSSVPVNSAKELIAYAKSNPGKVNYASGGKGTPGHLLAELFKQQTGAPMTHIPYNGNAPAVQSVVSGETQIMFTPTNVALPYIKAGKLKPLAVYVTDSVDELPGVSSLGAQGVHGFESSEIPHWYGILAPAGTPRDVIARLNTDLVQALKDREIEKVLRSGRFFVVGNSPEEFAIMIRDGYAAWGRLIRRVGATSE